MKTEKHFQLGEVALERIDLMTPFLSRVVLLLVRLTDEIFFEQ